MFQLEPSIFEAQELAVDYLETEVSTLTDEYDLAIVAYALRLANSTNASLLWKKLESRAVSNGM